MNLTRIRMLRGLSLADLGAMIGKDPSMVQRAEKMHHSAKLATYVACADALGVTLADIFCDELAPVEREIVEVFRSIPDAKRAVLVELIEAAKAPAATSDRSGDLALQRSSNE